MYYMEFMQRETLFFRFIFWSNLVQSIKRYMHGQWEKYYGSTFMRYLFIYSFICLFVYLFIYLQAYLAHSIIMDI